MAGLVIALEGLAWKDLQKSWGIVLPPHSLLTSTTRERIYSMLVEIHAYVLV